MLQTNKSGLRRTLTGAAAALAGFAAVAAYVAQPASAQMSHSEGAKFNAAGETSIPENFREWVFIGAPLTPNGLNGGAAGFPEFHHVYIEPAAYEEYKKTGHFPEGTTIVKELVLMHEGEYEDGSRDEPSGRGFFAKSFHGIDMMVKDSKRFPEGNGWGFFNFGHHAPPYAASAAAAPAESCSGCHQANATKDMVFTKFYPILNQ